MQGGYNQGIQQGGNQGGSNQEMQQVGYQGGYNTGMQQGGGDQYGADAPVDDENTGGNTTSKDGAQYSSVNNPNKTGGDRL